ncbi:MAG: hypothetical protein AAB376_02190 [Pseudomonadota bacterium]
MALLKYPIIGSMTGKFVQCFRQAIRFTKQNSAPERAVDIIVLAIFA